MSYLLVTCVCVCLVCFCGLIRIQERYDGLGVVVGASMLGVCVSLSKGVCCRFGRDVELCFWRCMGGMFWVA